MSPESRQALFRSVFRLQYLPVVLAPLVLMAPMLVMGRAMFWGTPGLQFVPWWWWSWETLSSGHLPLWNPLVGMGAPLVANYQSALFYPPNWLFMFLAAIGSLPALVWGQAAVVILHLALAGLGMGAVARSMGLSPLAQAIAGMAFGLSAYLVSRAAFLSIVATAAWLPWIMYAVKEMVVAPRQGRSLRLLAGLWAMQLLAGHAQTTWYTILLATIWAAYWAVQYRSRTDHSGHAKTVQLAHPVARVWGRLAFALSIGIGLSAVQLFPTAEYLLQSQRAASVEYEFAMTYSFWPWRIAGLITPDLFGNPAHGDYWGYGAYWEDAIYIGLIPVVMALSVILGAIRFPQIPASSQAGERNSVTRLLIFLLITSFVLALGKNTPIFPWLYRHVPTFDMFQAPTRFSIWAIFALALLAGLGIEHFKKPEGRALYWTRLGTAGAVAVALGAGLTWYFLGDVRPTFIRATAMAGLLGTGVGILLLVKPEDSQARKARFWRWAVSIFVGVDLIYAGAGLNPSVDLDFYRSPGPTAREVQDLLDGGRLFLAAAQEYDLKFNRFLTFQSFQLEENWSKLRAALLPNLNMLDHIEHVTNFDPLVPGRYAVWMETLEVVDGARKERLLNLSGVTGVESPDAGSIHGVRFERFAGQKGPRWVPCALLVESPEASLELLLREDFDPIRFLVIEGLAPEEVKPADACPRGSVEANVAHERPSPNQLAVQISTSADGWLFVPEVWYPGWQARLDGRRVKIWQAYYLFRAVRIPAGEHNLEFHYRPASFYVGGLISLATIVGIIWYIVRRK